MQATGIANACHCYVERHVSWMDLIFNNPMPWSHLTAKALTVPGRATDVASPSDQKSSVVPSGSGGPPSMRSGQSRTLMSQKRHSELLGTRPGGVSDPSRRMSEPRSSMNWPVSASCGIRTVWVGYRDLAADPDVPVPFDGQGQGVLVDHDLHAVPGLFPDRS